MCGITGIVRAQGLRPRDRVALVKMGRALRHRGPDGEGVHFEDEAGVAMGHQRLSIIDLSVRGGQPLVDPQDRIALTVNGELYDYKTHRARLVCDGERFVTKTDSEVALKLYRKHGLDFVHHLRGEFALALFDPQRRRMILVRDRFGIRPLYFHLTETRLVYGSEIKALFAHPELRPSFNERAVLHQLMQTMVPGMTLFSGVDALLPGHMMVVELDGGRLRADSRPYWDLDFPRADDHDPDPNDAAAVEAVRDALIDAVRVRLEADVPVGCYLSGGIDSCSILGLATAMQQSPVKAFTISFDDDRYDEATIARQMAARTGADQEVMPLRAADLYGDDYRTALWHSERTFYNTLGVAKWHMSRRVRQAGYKVVVTGEGSDEIFGGYPFFKRDHYRHSVGGEVPDSAHAGVVTGAILSETDVAHPALDAVVGFTPAWIQPWMLTLQQVRPLLAPSLRRDLEDYDPIAAIAESFDPERLDGRHPLDKAQYTWSKTMLEGQILNWGGDRVDMANSMESRPPFLDHLLVELCCTLAPSLRIRDGVEKWVLREAMRDILPEVLYAREKFAFMAPPAHTDQNKQRAVQALVDVHLASDAIEAAGVLDAGRAAAFLAQRQQTKDDTRAIRSDIILNHLLGLQVLHQQYVEGVAGPRPSTTQIEEMAPRD